MDQKHLLWLMLGITVGLLFLPFFMRLVTHGTSPGLFPFGSQPYIHLLISQKAAGHPSYPSELFFDRQVPITFFHRLLGFLSSGNDAALRWILILLPFFSGIVSVMLFQRLLAHFHFPVPLQFMTLLSLSLSPSFIHAFTVASPDALLLPVLLLGGVLFLSSPAAAFIFGSLLLVFGSLFSLFHALLIFFFLIFYLFRKASSKKEKQRGLIALALILVPLLFLKQPFLQAYRLLPFSANNLISDFGSVSGLSLFFIILLFCGTVFAWREKNRYSPLYLLCILFLPVLFVYPATLIYFTFISAPFVGYALYHFKESGWRFRIVGRITLFVIILGLLFSSLSYANRLKDLSPTPELAAGLAFLRDATPPDALVLSAPELGYFIGYFGRRTAFLDEALPPALFSQRHGVAESIFQSRNPDQVRTLLLERSITHLVITREMKEGRVWDDPEQGVLFVLRASETFKNIYAAPSMEIWEFVP